MAGEAVQQDHRGIGRLAGLRLEEVAAQGHAVARHLDQLGIGQVGQVLPAMRHLDRHAVGIAEGDRVVARREVVELLGRLQDLRAGLAHHGMDLVDLGAALGRDREPQRARPVGDAVLGLAHHEVIVAARPHHPVGARPDAMEAQHRQPQAMEGDRAAEVAHLDRGAGKGGARLHQRSGRPSARSSSRRRVLLAGEEELVELRRLDVACSTAWRAPGRDDGSGAGRDAPARTRRWSAAAVRLGRGRTQSRARLSSVWRSQKAISRRSLAVCAVAHRARIGEVGIGLVVAAQARRGRSSGVDVVMVDPQDVIEGGAQRREEADPRRGELLRASAPRRRRAAGGWPRHCCAAMATKWPASPVAMIASLRPPARGCAARSAARRRS